MKNTIARAGTPGVEVVTGGAPRFLGFLKEELIPFVESNYRIDRNSRLLAGYSFGGLFAMYVLFHEPGLFDKYFIGSPSLSYGEGAAFSYEASNAVNHSGLKAEVFMSAGELEKTTAENIGKMSELLLNRNYSDFFLETYIFPRENHVSCYPAAMSRTLIELFNNNK